VTASATAKYANDTCAATRAAPSVDMVSARAPVRGPRLQAWRFILPRAASRLEKSALRRGRFKGLMTQGYPRYVSINTRVF
jgi:hypothetical protein